MWGKGGRPLHPGRRNAPTSRRSRVLHLFTRYHKPPPINRSARVLKLIPSLGVAAVLPLLAAKQRVTSPNDWMSTDSDVACPDPNCKTKLRITRIGVRKFRHGETTVVPLPSRGKPESD